MRLSGAALEWICRRVVVIALFAWLPLLLLSVIGGNALGGGIKVPFLHDIEAHVRFLFVLPLLLGAELFIDTRLRGVVHRFPEQGVIGPASLVWTREKGLNNPSDMNTINTQQTTQSEKPKRR